MTRERLFFAITPETDVRAHCFEIGAKAAAGVGRPVTRENIHLTLFFLGATSPEQRACAEAAAAKIHESSFELALDTVGYFPKPKVIWIGATQIPSSLTRTVDSLSRNLIDCGFAGETRPFVPHITVARNARRAPSTESFPPIHWQCSNFALMRSENVGGKTEYRVLRTWPLTAAVGTDET